MTLRCRLFGHLWQIVRLHIGSLVGDRDQYARISWRCERCGEEREDTLHNVAVGIDVVPRGD